MSDDAVDVLIICALPEELEALVEVREGVSEPWTKVDGTPPYYTATLTGRAGPIRVAAVRSTKTAGVVGPIGSGNYVAANGKDWKRITKGGMRRILGVEQEVATIGKVAHDHRLPFVVAKGVMDHATSKKNDRFKKFAARASAEVW